MVVIAAHRPLLVGWSYNAAPGRNGKGSDLAAGSNFYCLLSKEVEISKVEKISVALSSELLDTVKQAVATGEYASTSEVIREALRDWKLRQPLRQAEVERLQKAWKEGLASGEAKPFDIDEIKRRVRNRSRACRASPTIAKIVRSPAAEDDLIDIWFAIALDDPAAADRLLDAVASRIEQFAPLSDPGPERPDVGEGARALSIGNYLVLYRHLGGRIEIVRVVHGARDLTTLL